MPPLSNFRYFVTKTPSENSPNFWREEGLALLIAVVSLSVFSLLGLYVCLNSVTEAHMGDNHESLIQAEIAARAGLNHARELIRGLQLNDLLRGADGVGTSTYPSTTSGKYAFRNWVDWSTARSLNILDPTSAISGLPDDGLFNTGKYGSTNGTILIPATGVDLTAPNPTGARTVIAARYFVKVTDNPEETDGDPFTDRDGIVIVRSTGVARPIREAGGGALRANSVAVYEGRFKQSQAFRLNAPVILQGDPILAASSNMFDGNSFSIDGGAYPYGIGTIDTNTANTSYPEARIKANVTSKQYNRIVGQCCASTGPAVGDITAALTGDQLLLLEPIYLWNLSNDVIPKFADNVFQGNQQWSRNSSTNPSPDLGYYDLSKPPDDPSQRPKLTYVNGDLVLDGGISGAGVLVVTGALKGNGNLHWTGLVLVIGKGDANLAGMNVRIQGALYAVNLQAGNPPTFGSTQFSISGNSLIQANDTALNLGVRNLPPVEISRREVTRSMDP